MGTKSGAHRAVYLATQRGDLPLLSQRECSRCGNQASVDHHYRGYSRRHYLSVVPLCHTCHGVEHAPDHPRRLSDDQVKKAREMRQSGESVKDIASHYKMNVSSMSKILLYKSYKWVK